tara:strand:- start:156 stop:500 length:345 start_codon:yes stop_codon:yes gene_type:complete
VDFKFIYKICTKAEWLEAKTKGKFNGSKKDIEDGYIHFSDKEQLKGTLNKFFSNQRNLILLKIDTLKLGHLIYEQTADGNMFPHLYSSLDMSNVSKEYDIILADNGTHILPSIF